MGLMSSLAGSSKFAKAARGVLLAAGTFAAAATAITAPSYAQEATNVALTGQDPFTQAECNTIYVAADQFTSKPDYVPSDEFMQSWGTFFDPQGAGVATCTGPREITWKKEADVVIFNAIGATLTATKVPVRLVDRGMKLIKAPGAETSMLPTPAAG